MMHSAMLGLVLGAVAVAAEPVEAEKNHSPLITPAPVLPRHLVAMRQETDNGCDYVDVGDALIELNCPGGGCSTSGDFYGCSSYFATTCFNFGDEACSSDAIGLISEHWCCNEDYPGCATLIMDDGGTTRTHFECYDFLSGEHTALAPSEVDTESGGGSVIISVVTAPPPSDVADISDSGTLPPQSTTSDPPDNGGDDKGGAAPVGAIVGGVIGGIALLCAVGFGFWFMRRWKKNHADTATAVTPATTQQTVYTGSPGAPGAGGAYYTPVPQHGYPPQGHHVQQHYDPNKAYIPQEPVEAPTDSTPRSPQELQ